MDSTQAPKILEAMRLRSNPADDAGIVSLPAAPSTPANAAALESPAPHLLPLPATAADSATKQNHRTAYMMTASVNHLQLHQHLHQPQRHQLQQGGGHSLQEMLTLTV